MKALKQIDWKAFKIYNAPFRAFRMHKKKMNLRLPTVAEHNYSLEKQEKEENFGTRGLTCLRRATNKDLIYNGSFHEAVRPVLLIAQCFALMPVKGVRAKDATTLSFRWLTPLTAYCLLILIGLIFYFCLTVSYVATTNFRLIAFDPVVFYGSSLCTFLTFINLAKKWPGLMRKWHEIEIKLPAHRSQLQKAVMAHKFKMIVLIVSVMSMTEHLLSIITSIHYTNYCANTEEIYESFFRIHLYHIFNVTNYSPWKAVLGKVLNCIGTFIWSYMDMFVMVVSVGLSEKFRQVNESMFRMKGKATPESFWRDHRAYYRNLCNLCEDMDNAISTITMVSFSNNLYFICVQLLKSLNPMPSVAHAVYFWFSLIFLLGRTLAVSLYSARINDESKRPVEIFRRVPKDSWCLEVKRFSQEVNSDVVALSGMRFFHLTRGLLLSVTGTIITYELVLFQFHVNTGVEVEC